VSAGEGGLADDMHHTGGRVAGRMDDKHLHIADPVGIALREQGVELRSVALKLCALVEYLAEDVLHDQDVAADADLAAQFLLDIGRAGQVVGMGVGLDDPLQLQAVLFDMPDDLVGTVIGDAPGGIVDVHHAVDHGAGIAVGIFHDIADGVGIFVEKRGDLRFYRHINRIICHCLSFKCER